MGLFSRNKVDEFIEANGEKLIHNLAHYSAVGSREVCEALKGQLPHHLNMDTIFMFLFSFRFTIESLGIKTKFGDAAYNHLLSTIDKFYHMNFREAELNTGPFSNSLMRDVMISISSAEDPRDWIWIHAVRTLETRDPEDELFHLCLGKVITNSEPMVSIIDHSI